MSGWRVLTVNFVITTPISITPNVLPAGKQGQRYLTQSIFAEGGTEPYSWNASGLPNGMELVKSSDTIAHLQGTPTEAGSFSVTITAIDNKGYVTPKPYTLVIAEKPTITITPASLPSGKVGVAYDQTLSASGGTAPYSFKVGAGSLPPGLSLGPDGKLKGTPTEEGTYAVWLGATDADGYGGVVGEENGWREYQIKIEASPISITPNVLPAGKQGQRYLTQSIFAEGGTEPYSWNASGLPNGMELVKSSDTIAHLQGTPTEAGSFSVTITATDNKGYVTPKPYTLVIVEKPTITITPASLPSGKVGVAYDQTLSASGGTAPYSFKVGAGSLPPGLSLGPDGKLKGTPTEEGTYAVWLGATDADGYGGVVGEENGWREYQIKIEASPISITPNVLSAGKQGQRYITQSIFAEGGTEPYSWNASGLPNGMELVKSSDTIAHLQGTPTEAGSFSVTITATDNKGYVTSKPYTLVIAEKPAIDIAPASLPSGKVGLAYAEQTLSASGGTAPYDFDVTGLPDGLTFAAGKIAGTPTEAGPFTVTITATDNEGYVTSKPYTLVIAEKPAIDIAPASLPSGKVGLAYAEQTLSASGGTAPYDFDVTGLPDGLTFAAGKIAGTPTEAGPFTVTITATDNESYVTSKPYTLVIAEKPAIDIAPASLPSGKVGLAYAEQTLSASGGTAPYDFDVTGLPDGLTFAAGKIAGTPTEAGPFTVTITATDNEGYVTSKPYTLVIAEKPAIDIAPASLPSGKVGLAYAEQTLSASGGTAPYDFDVTGLPDGLTFAAGKIAGTPTEAGPFTVTITATDNESYVTSKPYTLVIAEKPAIDIAPASLPSGKVGLAYAEQTLSASGGTAPYDFDVTGLPDGLTFAAGKIAGTPTEAGPFTVTITATDNESYVTSKPYTLVIAEKPAIDIAPASLPSGKVGLAYAEQTLSASGGTAPYDFDVTGLPDGLTFAAGKIAGTPTEAGPFTVTITATDNESYVTSKPYTLVIAEKPAIDIAPASLPSGKVGLAYAEQTLSASGGTAPYDFDVTGLPDGLTFAAGKIAGTPTEAGPFTVTITATDNESYVTSKPYTLVIAEKPAIDIAPASLPSGKVGLAYAEQTLSASGGTAPYDFDVTGLPDGLTFAAGKIAGTPTEAGPFTVTITATDNEGYVTSKPYTLVIAEKPAIDIAPASLPSGKVGLAYAEQTLSASGGTAPYDFDVTGLPDGLTFAAGKIAGTPTEAGPFTVTITATDNESYVTSKPYTLVIAEKPAIDIAPASLPSGKVGLAYAEQTLSASGGTAPYDFDVTGLPDGLTFAAGKIAGTPTEAGPFTVTITATDNESYVTSKPYTLVIAEKPAIDIAPASLPSGKVGLAYAEQTLSASGGTAPYDFDVTGLPDGLTFAAGKIAGTPTEAGPFTVTITATDNEGYVTSKPYTLVIAEKPAIDIAPASLPSGKVGLAYAEQTLSASGGTAPYDFDVTGLPDGLTFAAGKIAGTPTEAGPFTVTITATDNEGYVTSKPYTLVIAEKPAIEVKNHELTVIAGTTATVDLTKGAVGTPITGAKIVSAVASAAGSAWLEAANGVHMLHFNASPTFAGSTQLSYSLTNAGGSSKPAIVRINVIARPDPSKDPEVIGLVNAQVQTANRMVQMQISNYGQRLEQLHGEGDCRQDSIGLSVGLEGARLNPKLPQACSGRELSLWSNGALNFGQSHDDDGKLKRTSIHVNGGIDHRFSSSFTGGIGFGYGKDTTDIGKNGTQSRATMTSVAAYGSYRPVKNFFLDGVIGYGWLNFQSDRFVTATGGMASGERRSQQIFGSITLGYDYRNEAWLLSPYLRADVAHTKLSGFSETGAGIYNLTYGDQTADLLSGTLGIRAEYTLTTSWGELKPRARMEYTRDFSGSSRAKIGYYDTAGLLAYVTEAKSEFRESLKFEAGFDARIRNDWTAGLDYNTQFGKGSGTVGHGFRLKLSKRF
ncbi:putative Ig domain-containing protein [Brucella intermedia]